VSDGEVHATAPATHSPTPIVQRVGLRAGEKIGSISREPFPGRQPVTTHRELPGPEHDLANTAGSNPEILFGHFSHNPLRLAARGRDRWRKLSGTSAWAAAGKSEHGELGPSNPTLLRGPCGSALGYAQTVTEKGIGRLGRLSRDIAIGANYEHRPLRFDN
jgi:hypothetical protein